MFVYSEWKQKNDVFFFSSLLSLKWNKYTRVARKTILRCTWSINWTTEENKCKRDFLFFCGSARALILFLYSGSRTTEIIYRRVHVQWARAATNRKRTEDGIEKNFTNSKLTIESCPKWGANSVCFGEWVENVHIFSFGTHLFVAQRTTYNRIDCSV